MKTVQIVRLPADVKTLCSDTICDGRPAVWYFPQAPSGWRPKGVAEHRTSCNVHLGRQTNIVETFLAEDPPVDTGCAKIGTPLCDCGALHHLSCPADNTRDTSDGEPFSGCAYCERPL